jgi:hypothetical protein
MANASRATNFSIQAHPALQGAVGETKIKEGLRFL